MCAESCSFSKTCAFSELTPSDDFSSSRFVHEKRLNAELWSKMIWLRERTIYTRRGGSGGAGDLPREAGALHGLWPLLDFVLVAAAVQRHHLTGACSDMVHCWRKDRETRRITVMNIQCWDEIMPRRSVSLFVALFLSQEQETLTDLRAFCKHCSLYPVISS